MQLVYCEEDIANYNVRPSAETSTEKTVLEIDWLAAVKEVYMGCRSGQN